MQQLNQSDRASLRSQSRVSERLKDKVMNAIPLQSLNVELVDPKTLKPNAYNPNKQEDGEFELLRQSIKTDGFTMPVLVNKDLTIIDGEHRWRAALAEMLPLIPIVRLDLDETRMKISTIRHNKATGSHDAGLEAMVLADIEKLAGADFILNELFIEEDTLKEILSFTSAPDSLAGEEYGSSWTPVKSNSVYEEDANGQPLAPSTFRLRQTADSALVLRSQTQDANVLAFKKVVQKDAEAGKQSLYTVTAVFNPEEAAIVQKVLESPKVAGSTPAEKMLSLAEEKKAKEEKKND